MSWFLGGGKWVAVFTGASLENADKSTSPDLLLTKGVDISYVFVFATAGLLDLECLSQKSLSSKCLCKSRFSFSNACLFSLSLASLCCSNDVLGDGPGLEIPPNADNEAKLSGLAAAALAGMDGFTAAIAWGDPML